MKKLNLFKLCVVFIFVFSMNLQSLNAMEKNNDIERSAPIPSVNPLLRAGCYEEEIKQASETFQKENKELEDEEQKEKAKKDESQENYIESSETDVSDKNGSSVNAGSLTLLRKATSAFGRAVGFMYDKVMENSRSSGTVETNFNGVGNNNAVGSSASTTDDVSGNANSKNAEIIEPQVKKEEKSDEGDRVIHDEQFMQQNPAMAIAPEFVKPLSATNSSSDSGFKKREDKGKEKIEADQERSQEIEQVPVKKKHEIVDDSDDATLNNSGNREEAESNIADLPEVIVEPSNNNESTDSSDSNSSIGNTEDNNENILRNPVEKENRETQANTALRGAAGALAIKGAKGLGIAAAVGGASYAVYKYGPSIAKYIINSRPVKSVANYFWGKKNQAHTPDLRFARAEDAYQKVKETDGDVQQLVHEDRKKDKSKEKVDVQEVVEKKVDQKKLEEKRQIKFEQLSVTFEKESWADLYKNMFSNQEFLAQLKAKVNDENNQLDKLIEEGAKNPLIFMNLSQNIADFEPLLAKFMNALDHMNVRYAVTLQIIVDKYLQEIDQKSQKTADNAIGEDDQINDEVGSSNANDANAQEKASITEEALKNQIENAKNESWKKIYGEIFEKSLTPKQKQSEEIVKLIKKGAENPAIFQSPESETEEILIVTFLSTLNPTQYKCLNEIIIPKYFHPFMV